MKEIKNIIELHDELIGYCSRIQASSSKKNSNESHLGMNVYSAFFKIYAYAGHLHQAVLSLCEAGWTHVNAIILRTLMECSACCLAIINHELPEYMAFKYLYHPYLQIFEDTAFPKEKREQAKCDIELGFEKLSQETVIAKTRQYIDLDKHAIFWFTPEERGVSNIINDYGSNELKFLYGTLSMSAHAGHLGMFMFKDDPDNIDLSPSENPRNSKIVLSASCRLFLELLNIRTVYEGLGFEKEYSDFLNRIIAFKD